MLAWAAYLLVVCGMTSLAALGLERTIRPYGLPTRWIWMCALFGSLLLPVVLSQEASQTAATAAPAHVFQGQASRASALQARHEWTAGSPSGSAAPDFPRLNALVAVVWAASSGTAAAVLLAGWWYGRRSRRRWRRASVAGIELLVATDAGPATVGLLHPQIVVPEWLLAASPETLRLVLAHERSHVEARDPGLLGLGLGIAVLMPWNPLVWWQVHRLRLAIEVDCDRRVLRAGHDARLYARTLVDVGTRRLAHPGGLAASPRSSSSIERRIMLMSAPRIRGWRAETAACTLLSLAAATATVFISPPAIPTALAGSAAAAAEPTDLGRYAGSYEFSSTAVLQIELRNGELTAWSQPLTHLSGQEFRMGKVGCCSPDGDSFVRFVSDDTGRVIGAVFHQNGVATTAPRIDAQRVHAIDSAIGERVRNQAAAPGSETALRRLIAGVESGNPDYSYLSPHLAAGTRAILPDLQATMKPWGPLRSIEFRGVDSRGWDRYLVRFERGAASWEISLDSYGLIVGAGTHPESN